jgi:lycopene cyclase domain-containing protein
VPILVIAFWFLPQESVKISKKSFWWTISMLFPIGAGLDFFLARYFFTFPNESATLGIKAPALGAPIPIEEYIFYLTGFLCVLLLYIWLDEYWLEAYNIQGESVERKQFHRLLKLHPESLILAIVLVVGAIIFRKYFSGSPPGFPGYFIFLSLTALVPSSALLPSARPVINWRAFSLASLFVLLVSLVWEATLAIPYGWWNFRDEQMLGIRITAWGYLPIEEVCLWIAVTYATIIVYETVKCWQSSGRSMRHALFGE